MADVISGMLQSIWNKKYFLYTYITVREHKLELQNGELDLNDSL